MKWEESGAGAGGEGFEAGEEGGVEGDAVAAMALELAELDPARGED